MPRPKGSKNKKKTPAAPAATAVPITGEKTKEEKPPEAAKGAEKPAAQPSAADLEAQSNQPKEGDVWNGKKLLRRIIRPERIEVERPIAPQDRLGYADKLGQVDQDLDMLDKERKEVLADFGQRKAALQKERGIALDAVRKSTIRKDVVHHVVADYENGVMLWISTDTHETLDHKTRPLMENELQSSLLPGDRTKINPLRVVEGSKEEAKVPADDGPPTPAGYPEGAPRFGSKDWIKGHLPGFAHFDGEKPYWEEVFTKGMITLAQLKPPRTQFTAKEFEAIVDAGRKELAAKAAETKAKEEAAKPPPVTSADGGTSKDRIRYQDDPDNVGNCKFCKSDQFEHDEEEVNGETIYFCVSKSA